MAGQGRALELILRMLTGVYGTMTLSVTVTLGAPSRASEVPCAWRALLPGLREPEGVGTGFSGARCCLGVCRRTVVL